jgi:hypothetical protein
VRVLTNGASIEIAVTPSAETTPPDTFKAMLPLTSVFRPETDAIKPDMPTDNPVTLTDCPPAIDIPCGAEITVPDPETISIDFAEIRSLPPTWR